MNKQKSNTVKTMITHPTTGKRLSEVYITGKGLFRWNTVYHVYNSVNNYDQLQANDLASIDYSHS